MGKLVVSAREEVWINHSLLEKIPKQKALLTGSLLEESFLEECTEPIPLDKPTCSGAESAIWWHDESMRWINEKDQKIYQWIGVQNKAVVAAADSQYELLLKLGMAGPKGDYNKWREYGVYIARPLLNKP